MSARRGLDNSSETRRSPPTWPQHRPGLCSRKPFSEYTEEDWAKLRESQDRDIRRLEEALPLQLAEYERE
jgi:hypothetical protein